MTLHLLCDDPGWRNLWEVCVFFPQKGSAEMVNEPRIAMLVLFIVIISEGRWNSHVLFQFLGMRNWQTQIAGSSRRTGVSLPQAPREPLEQVLELAGLWEWPEVNIGNKPEHYLGFQESNEEDRSWGRKKKGIDQSELTIVKTWKADNYLEIVDLVNEIKKEKKDLEVCFCFFFSPLSSNAPLLGSVSLNHVVKHF